MLYIRKKSGRLASIDVFSIINIAFLVLVAALCVLPFAHVVAVSFSTKQAASAGSVFLFPVGFNLKSYEYVMQKAQFWDSAWISLLRIFLGGIISMVLLVLSAYPLAKNREEFRARNFFAWFMFIPMIFSGGLIPYYMIVKATGLLDSIWALIIPCSLQVFNVVLLLNFFRQLPKELDDAAFIDGIGHWRMLFQIYLPLTKPALATMALFIFVSHWNSWFDGMIFMSHAELYPLQTYIRSITKLPDVTRMTSEEIRLMMYISDRTMKTAQIVFGSIPVLLVYPFLQQYFVKGIVLGSVKG